MHLERRSGQPGNTNCLSNVGTFPGTYVQNPGVQGDNTSFYQDQYRETKQTAFFASGDFDIIPKVLTITAGTRHFLFQNDMQGSVLSSFGCFEAGAPPGGCHNPAYSYNLNAAEPARYRIGLQEPRQHHLAHHAGCDGVLHVLAGLSPGRLQPERRRPACLRAGSDRAIRDSRARTHPKI